MSMERWVVAYDIPDDRRRAKLARILDAFGDRTQYSVFEALVSDSDLQELCRKINALIEPDEDTVRLYPLCNGCFPKIRDLGLVRRQPFDEPEVIIV